MRNGRRPHQTTSWWMTVHGDPGVELELKENFSFNPNLSNPLARLPVACSGLASFQSSLQLRSKSFCSSCNLKARASPVLTPRPFSCQHLLEQTSGSTHQTSRPRSFCLLVPVLVPALAGHLPGGWRGGGTEATGGGGGWRKWGGGPLNAGGGPAGGTNGCC